MAVSNTEYWLYLMSTKMCNGGGNGTPLQYSCLENPMGRGAWWAAVHGVAKSRARLSDFTLTFHFHALEKEMATHSTVLAWRIPGTEEPSGLLSMGSHRVGHDWSDLAAAAAAAAARCANPGWLKNSSNSGDLRWFRKFVFFNRNKYKRTIKNVSSVIRRKSINFRDLHIWTQTQTFTD